MRAPIAGNDPSASEPRCRILVVDDDVRLLGLVCDALAEEGHRVSRASCLEEAREILVQQGPDVVVSDMRLPDGTGTDLLVHLRKRASRTPVVLMTAFGTVDTAVQAMSLGAFHFILKPFPMAQLKALVARAAESRALERENAYLKGRVAGQDPEEELIGESKAIRDVCLLAEKVAQTPATVLITGESGTGKEIVARLIHRQSNRAGGAYIRINCAAIPGGLLEAELFGHARGAFTGALGKRKGRFLAADGGTLFLDEVGSFDYDLQAKLLRVLQEQEIHPLGSDEPVKVDVRIVAATNQDPEALVRDGKMRQDLFFRLNVFPIAIPPLRQRMEDVAPLAYHLRDRIATKLARRPPSISAGVLRRLNAYHWPGNVRELENVIERAMILSGGEAIAESSVDSLGRSRPAMEESLGEDLDLARSVTDLEKRLVREALNRSDGVKKKAAALLGLSQRALSYYLRKHQIDR